MKTTLYYTFSTRVIYISTIARVGVDFILTAVLAYSAHVGHVLCKQCGPIFDLRILCYFSYRWDLHKVSCICN